MAPDEQHNLYPRMANIPREVRWQTSVLNHFRKLNSSKQFALSAHIHWLSFSPFQLLLTLTTALHMCLRAARPYWVSKLNSSNSTPVAARRSPLVRAPDLGKKTEGGKGPIKVTQIHIIQSNVNAQMHKQVFGFLECPQMNKDKNSKTRPCCLN